MAQFDGELLFNTRVDTRGFTQGANTVRSEANGLRNALAGLAKYFSVAFIIRGLVNLGKQAVETASDLQEVQNVVDTAFGDMSYKIENFSKTCIEMYGISELTAKQAASTWMAMSSGIGIATEKTSEMAINLTARMADMASFYNDSTDMVATALNSVYSGEMIALKKYGVIMTEANLQQFALEKGITKKIQKMTQAEQVQLRYNYVMAKTAISQGDFARTSESWANSTRVLTEEFKVLLGTVGNGLMQLFIPGLRVINSILSSMVGLANTVGSIFSDIFGTSKNIYTVAQNTGKATDSAADGISNIGDTVDEASKSINKNIAPFDELNQISSDLADSTGQIDLGGVSNGLETVTETTDGSNKLADTVKDAKDGIDGLGLAIVGLVTTFTTYEVIKLISKFGSMIGLLSTSPAGIIALAVGGLVMLGTALYELWRQAKLDDLNARFGDITLSIEEMGKVAKEIVDNGTMDKLGVISTEWTDLEGIQAEIQGAVDTLNKLNWKVGIGMELTEQEQEQYKQAINTYIEKTQQYASEQKEAVLLSLDFLLADSSTKTNIVTKTNEFYSAIQGELDSLGRKLSAAVTEAWEDGLLTIDEAEKIQQIQTQMNNILKELAASEYNANLELIKMKFSGVELTPDTYKDLADMITDTVQQYVDDYDGSVAQTIAVLDAEVRAGKISTEDYDAAIAEIKKERLSNIGTIALNATRFSITTLTDAFEKEMGASIPKMKKVVADDVTEWFDQGYIDDGLMTYFPQLAETLNDGYDNLDSVARSNLEDLLEFMKPSKTKLEELKAECVAAGQEVPKSITDGLTSIYQMEALAGDVDAIYYMIGVQIGKSPEYTTMINKALKAGKWVPQKVIEGMGAKDAQIAGSVDELFKLLGVSTQEQSKVLNELMGSTGKSAAEQLEAQIRAKIPSVEQATKDLLKAIKDNIKNAKMPDITLRLQTAKQFNDQFYNPLSVNGYATGTVVPANYGKFLGVLGDNTRETEVVSPLSTMKQAFKEAMSEMGGNQSGSQHITLNLNGRAILDAIVEADEDQSKSTGYKLLNR